MLLTKLYLFILLLGNLAINKYAQVKAYELVAKTTQANLHYSALKKMTTLDGSDTANIRRAFQPVKGKFTVYQFVATYQGTSFRGEGDWTFHDLLTLKTDTKGRILDAYQYTLEWAEPPASSDLFRSTVKNIYLKDQLAISLLKFIRTHYTEEHTDNQLNDLGVLILKK
jgi:hypothetical protein